MNKIKLFISALYIALPASALAGEVKIYNWESYISEEVIAAFTKETGHTVSQLYFSKDTERNSLFATSRADLFDLIMFDNVHIMSYGQSGRLHSISDLKLNNINNIDSRWQNSCGEYGIAYSWGTTGIAYRSSLTSSPIDSWSQFFQPPAAFKGRLTTTLDPEFIPYVALLAAGKTPNDDDTTSLKQAYTQLKKLPNNALSFEYGISYAIKHKEKSKMAMTLVFSGDRDILTDETKQQDWVYVVPKEGTILWVDCWGLPANRPVNEATKAFLEFTNRIDMAALNAESNWLSTPISKAIPLTSKSYQADEELFPPKDILERSYTLKPATKENFQLKRRMILALKNQ